MVTHFLAVVWFSPVALTRRGEAKVEDGSEATADWVGRRLTEPLSKETRHSVYLEVN